MTLKRLLSPGGAKVNSQGRKPLESQRTRIHLAPEGRHAPSARGCFAPPGLELGIGQTSQGLTPLAIYCRPSGAKEPLRTPPKRRFRALAATIVAALALLLTSGCQQKMAHQPHFRPLQDAEFFSDGSSARPLEEGTIARGFLRDDDLLNTGMQTKDGKDQLATDFPFPITKERLERGRDQFNIYCAICHDRVGTGRGKVVQRGYLRPPTYHQPRLREAPVGHFFEVITRGYGGMPDYAQQIPPVQRWEIIAYIRALQLSQNVRLDDLPVEERKRLEEEKK
jgi:mono/diheme cytochrome c family protein